MEAVQFTFISKAAHESFSVVGTDRKDVTKTAFELAGHIDLPCAVVCKPITFSEPKPCAA